MSIPLESDLLRTFVAVANSRNFTRAGETIGRTQSAVSIQMKRLEEVVGEQLFVRNARGIDLTSKGQQLLGNARKVVSLLDETAELMRAAPLCGEVRVGIPEEYSTTVLPEVLARFAKSHPEVEVSAVIDTSCAFPEAIDQDKLDIAIVFSVPNAVRGELIFVDPSVWVTSVHHDVHLRRPLPVAMYERKSPWVTGGWCHDYALRSLDDAGIDYRIVYNCNANNGLEASMRSGMAIAPMSRSCIPADCRELTMEDGFGTIDSGRVMLQKNPKRHSPAVAQLETTIRSAFTSGLIQK